MHNISLYIGTALVALTLAGCNAKDPSQPKPPTPQAEGGSGGGVIPQAQIDALNKARNVENVLKEGAQRNEPAAD